MCRPDAWLPVKLVEGETYVFTCPDHLTVEEVERIKSIVERAGVKALVLTGGLRLQLQRRRWWHRKGD